MKVSHCSCSCGNLKIKGKIVPNCMYPNIPLTGKEHLRLCKNLFSIQPQSVDIHNYNQICGHTLSKVCSSLKCTACGSTFLFFSWAGYSYFGKIQQQSEKNNKLSQNHKISKYNGHPLAEHPQNIFSNHNHDSSISMSLPNMFKYLISNNKQKFVSQENEKKSIDQNNFQVTEKKYDEDENFFANDVDFELMFSNKSAPYVGSFAHDLSILNDA